MSKVNIFICLKCGKSNFKIFIYSYINDLKQTWFNCLNKSCRYTIKMETY